MGILNLLNAVENRPFYNDPAIHRNHYKKWLLKQKYQSNVNRILTALDCSDCDDIPKVKKSGCFISEGGKEYQILHNGLKVDKGIYCGLWMSELIYGLRGHHEPQEEKAFYEVLKHIQDGGIILELGSYWGYYSMWFIEHVKNGQAYLVEPDPRRLNIGKKQFELNHLHGNFIRGYVGKCGPDAGDHIGAQEISIDAFFSKYCINHIHILHSDIQGAELLMLQSARNSLASRKIEYLFISTHSNSLHHACRELLKSYDYMILGEHLPIESYSIDGLIVASIFHLEVPMIKLSKRKPNK